MLSREPHFVVITLFCPFADDIYIVIYYIYIVYYSLIYLSNQEGLLIISLCVFSRICFSNAVIVIDRHDSVTNRPTDWCFAKSKYPLPPGMIRP
jgi:hypothetical protein